MTDLPILNFFILAASIFNTIVLTWLGMTVWLTADRDRKGKIMNHRWGVWIISGGSLIGALFFISHTALLGLGLAFFFSGVDFWITAASFPIIFIPFLWYIVILWFTGFWEPTSINLRRRHRLLVWLLGAAAGFLAAWTLILNPLPSYSAISRVDIGSVVGSPGFRPFVFLYLGFVFSTFGLSLDALYRPGTTTRMMGQQARRRARPWLMTASFILLLVSLVLAVGALWVFSVGLRSDPIEIDSLTRTVGFLDLVLSALIGVCVFAMGQAVVSYEIFTGHTLPRRGLRRQWRRVIILAFGFGLLLGAGLAFEIPSIYTLLLTTVAMTAFFALLSWRSFRERDTYIAQLRPFVESSPRLDPADASEDPIDKPFSALCDTVLDAKAAYLFPIGGLGSIVEGGYRFPKDAPLPQLDLSEIANQFSGPEEMILRLSGDSVPRWAVSLWGARGMSGLLLLSGKRDGGLYTQEEIETARALCERLLDLQARMELSRRLLSLQRDKLAESQVIDRRARRTLHDEVLPKIHTALLDIIGEDSESAKARLTNVHQEISALLRGMPPATRPDFDRRGLLAALREVIDVEYEGAIDAVEWTVPDEADELSKTLPALTTEVIFYAAREVVRNAVRHGRNIPEEPLKISIGATFEEGVFQLQIADNGSGISENGGGGGGSGQGLALHTTMMEVIGGSLTVESKMGEYTQVQLSIPTKK